MRRAVVRTGIVLAPNEGALKIMTPIFKLGPGAPIGSGGRLGRGRGPAMDELDPHRRHRRDLPAGHRESRRPTARSTGPRPIPVRNAEFARTFSAVLRKHADALEVLPARSGRPMPCSASLLGEVATVITTGQRVLPAKAAGAGLRVPVSRARRRPARDLHRGSPRGPRPPCIAARPAPGSHH